MLVAGFLAAVLTVGALVGWFTMPPSTRALFSAFQIVTLIVFVLVMDFVMLSVTTGYVRADESGLTFRNALRTHVLPWSTVGSIRFEPGMPWPSVMLADDFATDERDHYMLMGIQTSDGRHAVAQVERLRAAIAAWQAAG